MTSTFPPKLAAPGAGLPAMELIIGRTLFSLNRLLANKEGCDARFELERNQVLALCRSSDRESAGKPVLIRRQRGMEDSSRCWSVWMTLDHLRICNGYFGSVIRDLSEDRLPAVKADTAKVKPSPEAGPEMLEAFQQSCDLYLEAVSYAAEKFPQLKTRLRHSHPWFGPLDAAGWHQLQGMHTGIHRRQIEMILKGLS